MMQPTLTETLAELQRLCDQATPEFDNVEIAVMGGLKAKHVTEFVAAARTAVPALIEALELAIEQRDSWIISNDYADINQTEIDDAELAAILTKGKL
jgi:hypothetical protein